MRQRPEVVRRALLGYSTSTPSRSKPSASDLPNSNPPPHYRPENAEYSVDVSMKPLSGSTKDGDQEYSGQIIQPGDYAPKESPTTSRIPLPSSAYTAPPKRVVNPLWLDNHPSRKGDNNNSTKASVGTSTPLANSVTNGTSKADQPSHTAKRMKFR
jgi:hypothetical protein